MARNEGELEMERWLGTWRPIEFPKPTILEEAAYIRPEVWRGILIPLLPLAGDGVAERLFAEDRLAKSAFARRIIECIKVAGRGRA